MMPNGNMQGVSNGYHTGVQLFGGVGSISGSTRPAFGVAGTGNAAMVDASHPGSNDPAYNGPYADKSFFGEPFAVWLGMILLLVGLRFFASRSGAIGEAAHIRIGGYNFLAVGVTSAVFIALLKVIFNRVRVPGVTEFANSL